MKNCISENFDWYVENLGILSDLYPNRYVIIKDKQVVCDCLTFNEAVETAHDRGLTCGTYNIQFCGGIGSERKVLNPLRLVNEEN